MKSCKDCLHYAGIKDSIVGCLAKNKAELEKERMIYPLFYAGNCSKYKEINYRF